MPLSLHDVIIPWLIHYQYLVLFPITVVEGPIITIIAGFLLSLGYMDAPLAYAVIVVADVLGDCMYYGVGHFGGEAFVRRWGRWLGITHASVDRLSVRLQGHSGMALLTGKVLQGLGTVVLIAAGLVRMPLTTFIAFNTLGTMVKSLALLVLGFYFGEAYAQWNIYLDYAAIVTTVLGGGIGLSYYLLVVRRRRVR